VKKAIEKTVEFSKIYQNNKDINEIMKKQIEEFINEMKNL